MNAFLVLLVGAVIVLAGLFTVTRKNPIHASLAMLISLGGVGILMLALKATFLAAMQLLLYAGAIMVLFTFVIMLLTLDESELGQEPSKRSKTAAAIGAILLVATLFFALAQRKHSDFQVTHHAAQLNKHRGQTTKTRDGKSQPVITRRNQVDWGSTEHFARFLYTDYAVAFELITVLVMAAVAGVIVLARRPDSHTLERTGLTAGHGVGRQT